MLLQICRRSQPLISMAVCLLVHSSVWAEELNNALLSIRADDLRKHIDVLADDTFEGREAGSRGGRAAGVYLWKQLQRYGLRPGGEDGGYFQEFHGGCRNVLGLLEGSDPVLKHEILLIGAHYDHVGYGSRSNSYGPLGYIHSGADDNASGVAGLLELIEALTTVKPWPRRSILFAFWDGEEKGLWGSKHWVANSSVPMQHIVFALNVDMIGRMRDDTILVYGARTGAGLRRLVSEENRTTDLGVTFSWELKENSDHYSFFARNIPVLMVHTGLHDDYHRPSDDAHRINFEGSERATRLLFQLAHALSNRPQTYAFRQECRTEPIERQMVLEQPAIGRKPRLGIDWQPIANSEKSVVVDRVVPGSPGALAGLLPGDRILEFNGRQVADERLFRRRILAAPSQSVIVVARGENTRYTLPVELAGSPLRWGLSWRSDDAEPGTAIVTEVVPGSAAEHAGLKLRDRIYAVDNRDFGHSDDLVPLLTNARSSVQLLIERDGRLRSLAMELADGE
jgi:hypothetical protein